MTTGAALAAAVKTISVPACTPVACSPGEVMAIPPVASLAEVATLGLAAVADSVRRGFSSLPHALRAALPATVPTQASSRRRLNCLKAGAAKSTDRRCEGIGIGASGFS
ncbi:hypothetical protein Aca07nite_71730 [Actinoplanes capillaceus]|uniref:Secreted protein n=1 Tax=Actinoplanes campanulatus TaxID=113559 RepID=A0ABQ3WUN9_9ACTN|nr:hypothetical protein Aca07nite_71730 [Actinoplanes capillaceus]